VVVVAVEIVMAEITVGGSDYYLSAMNLLFHGM
jgi:hypothetical protein